MSKTPLELFLESTSLQYGNTFTDSLVKTSISKNITLENWNKLIEQLGRAFDNSAETYTGFKAVSQDLQAFKDASFAKYVGIPYKDGSYYVEQDKLPAGCSDLYTSVTYLNKRKADLGEDGKVPSYQLPNLSFIDLIGIPRVEDNYFFDSTKFPTKDLYSSVAHNYAHKADLGTDGKVKSEQLPNLGFIDLLGIPFKNGEYVINDGDLPTANLYSSIKWLNNNKATLGDSGKLLSSQLPSYVDDAVEYSTMSAFPATGAKDIIYVALDTGISYRWTGSVYSKISTQLPLYSNSGTEISQTTAQATEAYSAAFGNGTHANTASQFVAGTYNVKSTGALFVLGNGISDDSRANLFEAYADGRFSYGDASSNLVASPFGIAFGQYNNSIAPFAEAFGTYVNAIGEVSHGEGIGTNPMPSELPVAFPDGATDAEKNAILQEIYDAWYANKFHCAWRYNSRVQGKDCLTLGTSAFAQGLENAAIGNRAVALGNGNTAEGNNSFACGSNNVVKGLDAGCIGQNNVVQDSRAVAFGADNIVKGSGSGTIGWGNTIANSYGYALGHNNSVAGTGAGVIGCNNTVSDNSCYAFGDTNEVTGLGSGAIGQRNQISQGACFAVGRDNTLTKFSTVAIGRSNTVDHHGAQAFGFRLKSSRDFQTIIGAYNADNRDALFVIGNGTSSAPLNAFEVTYTKAKGVGLKLGNTELTETQLIKLLSGSSPDIYAVTVVNNTEETLTVWIDTDSISLPAHSTLPLTRTVNDTLQISNFVINPATYYVVSGSFSPSFVDSTGVGFLANTFNRSGTITISPPQGSGGSGGNGDSGNGGSGGDSGGGGGSGEADVYGFADITVFNPNTSPQSMAYMIGATESQNEYVPTGTHTYRVYCPSLISFYQVPPSGLSTTLETSYEVVGNGTFITSYVHAKVSSSGKHINLAPKSNGAVTVNNYTEDTLSFEYKPVDGITEDDRYAAAEVHPGKSTTVFVQTPGWVTVPGEFGVTTRYPTETVIGSSNVIVYVNAGVNIEQSITLGVPPESGSPHVHTWSAWSNVGNGSHSRTCSGCGAVETDSHSFGNWQPISAEDDTHERYCNICGAQEGGMCSFSGWSDSDEYVHSRRCVICGRVQSDAHTRGYFYTGAGSHEIACSVCSHHFGEDACTFNKAVDVGSDDYHSLHCRYCGGDDGVTEAHNYDAGVDDGQYTKYTCKSCGHTYSEVNAIG